MVKGLFIFMFGLGSNGYFVTGAPYLNGGSVGHPRSDSVELLVMDGAVHIWGTGVILQIPRYITNPVENGLKSSVDHLVLSYDMIFLL
jgi:hypothetical protein